MRAVILGSGFNIRMKPVTQGMPKAFLRIGEKTLLDLIIDSIPRAIRVTVTSNKLWEYRFRDWQSRRVGRHIRLFVEEIRRLEDCPGTIGSLENFINTCKLKDSLLVMATDNYLPGESSLAPFIDKWDGESVQIAVQEEYNKLRLSDHGVARLKGQFVQEFVEKPAADPWPDDPLPRWTGILCYIFPSSMLSSISNREIMDRAPAPKMPRGGDFIAHLVASGYPVTAQRFFRNRPDSWVRITTPMDYLKLL